MNEIIKQIKAGKFKYCNEYMLTLNSGVEIWVGNGFLGYGFRPGMGTKFTLSEKLKIRKAIKQGMIKKAGTLTNPTSSIG